MVPRPTYPTERPEDAMLAAFDTLVICPQCGGRKATMSRDGHASVCTACGGKGEVSEFLADQYAAMSAD